MQEIVNPKLDHVYTAPRGGKFKIEAYGALFGIVMLGGGIPPKICSGKFTSFKMAKATLERYFENNPAPVPRATTPEQREARKAAAQTKE